MKNLKIIVVCSIMLSLFLWLQSCVGICTPCDNNQYAPADAEISWTSYNSISKVLDYFGGYALTTLQHKNDTVLVSGYLPESFLERCGFDRFTIISNLDYTIPRQIHVTNEDCISPSIEIEKIQDLGKKVYVKGFPRDGIPLNPCEPCEGSFYLCLISVDTIP